MLALAAALAVPALAAAGTPPLGGKSPHQIRVRALGKPRVVMGTVGRAYLGLQMLDINDELREFYGAPADAGLLISRVVEDSPAAAAGIEVGDVLTRLGDEPARSSRDVVRAMARLEPEATVAVEVVRDGAPLTVNATLGHQEESAWFSHDFDMPEVGGMFFFGERDPEAVIDTAETEEAVRQAVEQARQRMSEIDLSGLTEAAMRRAIVEARERVSQIDLEALTERLAATRSPPPRTGKETRGTRAAPGRGRELRSGRIFRSGLV